MRRNSVVLGSFDGVHLGHKSVISLAKGIHLTTAAVYFYMPPNANGEDKQLLTDNSTRKELFAKLGVKKTLCLDFDRVRQMSPEAFFGFLQEKFNPVRICCGFNYRFGKDAAGDISTLKELCDRNGIKLCVASAVKINGQTVSSTAIREYISNGEIEKANEMLGYSFSFGGEVVYGDGRGAALGFPTANIYYPDSLVKPKPGVYVTNLIIDNKKMRSVTNIGLRPTYPAEKVPSESFVLGVNKNFYGKQVKVELLHFIRENKKFESAKELSKAIENDIKSALETVENFN